MIEKLTKLKNCPFCGGKPVLLPDNTVECMTTDCPMHPDYIMPIEKWNNRPKTIPFSSTKEYSRLREKTPKRIAWKKKYREKHKEQIREYRKAYYHRQKEQQ